MPGRANVEIYACDADDMGWYDVVDFKALSSDERIRAERFFDSQDAHRYRIAHALLRSLLGAATGMPAAALVLKAGRHGKPYLSNGPSFNLSHSGSRIVIGLMQRGKIGVDVEVIKPIEDDDRLALRWFSEEEVEALSSLRGEQWLICFFRIWTRKEAFVKALGGGLSIALDSFSVSLDDVSDDLLL